MISAALYEFLYNLSSSAPTIHSRGGRNPRKLMQEGLNVDIRGSFYEMCLLAHVYEDLQK